MVTGIEITTIQGLGGLILFIVFFILASNSTNQFAVLFRLKSLSLGILVVLVAVATNLNDLYLIAIFIIVGKAYYHTLDFTIGWQTYEFERGKRTICEYGFHFYCGGYFDCSGIYACATIIELFHRYYTNYTRLIAAVICYHINWFLYIND